MQTLTELILSSPYRDRVINEQQMARLTGGSSQRRYGLVNRAIRAGELIRGQRGLYFLPDNLRTVPLHPFHLAQALRPGSHISLETALAWHGWIPESVYETASVKRGGRSRTLELPEFGRFSFTPIATHALYHLTAVERLQLQGQTALIARPARALLDLVCSRRLTWQGMDWFVESLRISPDNLQTITAKTLKTLRPVYKHKRMQEFIDAFMKQEPR